MAKDDDHNWGWDWDSNVIDIYIKDNPYSRKFAKEAWKAFLESSGAASASFEKIIDMGCGPGDITETLVKWKDIKNEEIRDGAFKNKGSQNKEIVGTDVSDSAIAFCRENRNTILDDVFGDPVKLYYDVADSGDPLGAFWKKETNIEKFDLVTSFTAFHYIPDQEKALQCVSTCLKPGGRLVLFIGLKNHFLQTGSNGLKSNPKWEPFIKDVYPDDAPPWMNFVQKGLIPSKWNPSDIADAYVKLASKVGLQVECKCTLEKVFHDDDNFRAIVSAWSPFLKVVPEEVKQDLLDDIINEMKRLRPPVMHDGKMCVVMEYDMLLVHGVKKM